MTRWPLGLLCLACAAACANTADAENRARRVQADATLASSERECATRFVVASCLAAAKTEHRQTLAELRRESLARDDTRRRAAAEARLKSVEGKSVRDAAAVAKPSDAPPARARRVPPAPSANGDASAAPDLRSRPRAPRDRAASEQRRRAEFEARQQAAQAHLQAVMARNEKRRATGKLAAPLPLPNEVSASR